MIKKIFVITGASSDIGTALLERLATQGEDITAFCQYHSGKDKLVELNEKYSNMEIIPFGCDLSDEDSVIKWIDEIKKTDMLPTHIVHLAAGRFNYVRIKDFDWERTKSELTIQVNTLAQLFKAFLPGMSKVHYGKIAVMLTACTIGVPPKYLTEYVINKYAVLGLIKSAASEYSGKGITINGLSPNMIETKFLSDINPKMIEMTAMNSAMKRNVQIDEAVDGLMFLLSDSSNYINGINLNMTGGDR